MSKRKFSAVSGQCSITNWCKRSVSTSDSDVNLPLDEQTRSNANDNEDIDVVEKEIIEQSFTIFGFARVAFRLIKFVKIVERPGSARTR